MIKKLAVEPKPAAQMEQTPGRKEGLIQFSDKLISLYGKTLDEWTMLDVGGGDGWFADFMPCREYWCLDPYQAPLVATLRQNVHHVHGFAEALPFGDMSLDIVVSKQTLVHFNDPAKALHEMMRVAKSAIVIRQEFPEEPIGWPGHSRVTIDSPHDILPIFHLHGWAARFDGVDFVCRWEGLSGTARTGASV